MLWDSRSWITDYYNETGDLTTYYKGMEIGEIWGFRTAGIYASNADALNGPAYNFFKNGEMFRAYAGDLRFVDVDGDGIMTKGNRTLSNHGDLEIIGNQSPRYQYSINMSLNWNGIGLSMLWQGVGKRDWYPWTESGFFWGKWNRAYNSLMKTQTGDNVVRIDKSTDNWRVTNMDKNPYWTRMVSLAANRNDGPLTWENDHYLQDASYIRLKNITIDYTFPKHICKKLRLEGLKVYLSGEMFADVRRDEDRPFIVSADRLEVKVLGTQFNLKSYQEDAKSEVSLVRGKVSVGIKASKMNGKLTLAPGDILRFNKTNNHIDFLNFDPDSYANWIDNDNFFFVEQTLGDIVADLRRHFAVEIVVTDKSLCDETYYASFVNEESLDEILDALNKDRLFSVRREAEVYYISPPLK